MLDPNSYFPLDLLDDEGTQHMHDTFNAATAVLNSAAANAANAAAVAANAITPAAPPAPADNRRRP